MSPLKLIIYAILILLVIRMVRRFIGRLLSPASYARAGRSPRQPAARAKASKMVRCQACGTFITESSALVVGESGFCSRACAEGKFSHA